MARYKRETLESKTVKDLRQLVVKLGIAGFTKKPKAVIVDAIMAKYGAASSSAGAATIAKAIWSKSCCLARIAKRFACATLLQLSAAREPTIRPQADAGQKCAIIVSP